VWQAASPDGAAIAQTKIELTIVAYYIYGDGVRAQPFDIERGQIPEAANEIVWIGVHDPDQWELSSL
jgi:magnesium transporter